jgi:hypothetical protein
MLVPMPKHSAVTLYLSTITAISLLSLLACRPGKVAHVPGTLKGVYILELLGPLTTA